MRLLKEGDVLHHAQVEIHKDCNQSKCDSSDCECKRGGGGRDVVQANPRLFSEPFRFATTALANAKEWGGEVEKNTNHKNDDHDSKSSS